MKAKKSLWFYPLALFSLLVCAAEDSYRLVFPTYQGNPGQVLGLENDLGDFGWITVSDITTGTIIELYGDVIGSSTATMVATICGQSACSLVTTITMATSADVPLTLVLRDSTGSFVATNLTLTGVISLEGSGGTLVTLQAPAAGPGYTLLLPDTLGVSGQVLTSGVGNPNQLVWQTVSSMATGTSCDEVNALVMRDDMGSFVATTLTLTGNSLINYATDMCGLTGEGFVWAPTNENTLIGVNAGNDNTLTGGNNTGLGFNALANIVSGTKNIAIGSFSGSDYTSSESNNIIIGSAGVAGDSQVIRIGLDATPTLSTFVAGIYGSTIYPGQLVSVDQFGQLGYDPTSLVATATVYDIPNTLVLRDTTGSFVATNITLTGCLMLSDSTGALAGTVCANTNALSIAPQGTRALQATASGNNRGTNAVDLQINNGSTTIASGNYSVIAGGSSNTAQGQYDVIAGGQNNSTVITSNDLQAGYNMIMTGSKNTITINDIITGTNICGYNSIGGASNTIIISTTAATVAGLIAGFNAISSGNQNSIAASLPAFNFTSNSNPHTITGLSGAYGIAITPNGQYAYISDYGTTKIYVVSLATNTIIKTITVALNSYDLAVTPDGQFVYLTNQTGIVTVVSTATNSVVATIPVGTFPGGIAITPNGQYAYVANDSGNSVSVINIQTNAVIKTLAGFNAPQAIAVTPNGQYAYVANGGANNVKIINIASNTVEATIAVQSEPGAIAITPNGQYAYVANTGSNSVSVINLATNAVTTIGGFNFPIAVAITPNGQYAYVANNGSGGTGNTVSVINLATNKVIDSITVGSGPMAIAIAPNGQYAYVANAGSATVSVILTQLAPQGENFIGGGAQNSITLSPQPASIGQHVIAGGFSNTITCTGNGIGVGSFIGGGSTNSILSSPGVIGGGYLNTILVGGFLATIGGGQYNQAGNSAFIGGGQGNLASGTFSTIAAGYANTATGIGASIVGGCGNQALGNYAAIVGGQYNLASGNCSFVATGTNNITTGNASFAMGINCTATGNIAVALGNNAYAGHNNSFVWADGQAGKFFSSAIDTFNIRALNGLVMQGNSTGAVTLGIPSGLAASYALTLPLNTGLSGQVLSTNGQNSAQLSWITTVTNTTQLNLLYTATSYDVPSTLVLRDTSGSFIATTVTLTGNSLINYASLGGLMWAPNNQNTLIGLGAGKSNALSGGSNTALGFDALANIISGTNNIAFGALSGSAYTSSESNNILIGSAGVTGDSQVIRIGLDATPTLSTFVAGIYNVPGSGNTVQCTLAGQLVAPSSSKRYKENIAYDITAVSQNIFNLQPARFNYTSDAAKETAYGLLAEEVACVLPDLVINNNQGEPESVKYTYLPILMLNEQQKDHKLLGELQQTIAELMQRIETLESKV